MVSALVHIMGHVAQVIGDDLVAARHFEERLAMCRLLVEVEAMALLLYDLGALCLQRGELEAAEPQLQGALDLFGQMQERRIGAATLGRLGAVAVGQGRYD
ncbi:MAG: hypothetical protein ACRDFS_12480, partial [Chloroflexota bacterium]